jgi:hypothetical protein
MVAEYHNRRSDALFALDQFWLKKFDSDPYGAEFFAL